MFSAISDGISRQIEGAVASVSGAFFEPVVRLGVTGLSRAGKTVFITGLVANLLDRGRMPQLRAQAEGRIEAVQPQPQPDVTLPRFAFEDHLAALTGDDPRWPASTRAISELRLSFRCRPAGFFGGLSGPRTVHLDIVDYPGEWLLDLALLDKSYAEWSEATLERIAKRPYQVYEELFSTKRWAVLAEAGALPQRPLWASTGVKDPAYPDTLYVTELAAANVVNTMPEKTLDATYDHGVITGDTITGTYTEANNVLAALENLGISYNEIVTLLETEGLDKFVTSWKELLTDVENALTTARKAV